MAAGAVGEGLLLNPKGIIAVEIMLITSFMVFLGAVVFFIIVKNQVREKYSEAKSELNLLNSIAKDARNITGKTIREITLNDCSACICKDDLRNISSTKSCFLNWSNALGYLKNHAGVQNIDELWRDPWGSPYLLDENEREGGPSDCRSDTITTAGADGIYGTGDDIGLLIPLYISSCP